MDKGGRTDLTLFHVINLSSFFDNRNSIDKLNIFKVKSEQTHMNTHTLVTLKKLR